MFIQQAYRQLFSSLSALYGPEEAHVIADIAIEKISGLKRVDRLIKHQLILSAGQEKMLENYVLQLLAKKPIQYVTGEAWFYSLLLKVNPFVLIPRPETEELVEWILKDHAGIYTPKKLIDIGTGSGCIPIALKKHQPNFDITAIDISIDALQTAKENAIQNEVEITFLQADFLQQQQWPAFGTYNLIVSNPPYITNTEKSFMEDHVIQYEPHTALFVADHEPLVFYDNIANFGLTHLEKGGLIYVELNQALGIETKRLFDSKGYTTELRKDINANFRMLKAAL